jgi:hypothetical protein
MPLEIPTGALLSVKVEEGKSRVEELAHHLNMAIK